MFLLPLPPLLFAAVLAGIRGKIEMFNFSAATLERAGLPSSAATNIPPFVVIASNDINQVRQAQSSYCG